MKYDKKRNGYILAPEELAELNAKMKDARALYEIMQMSDRYGWSKAPALGGNKYLN